MREYQRHTFVNHRYCLVADLGRGQGRLYMLSHDQETQNNVCIDSKTPKFLHSVPFFALYKAQQPIQFQGLHPPYPHAPTKFINFKPTFCLITPQSCITWNFNAKQILYSFWGAVLPRPLLHRHNFRGSPYPQQILDPSLLSSNSNINFKT